MDSRPIQILLIGPSPGDLTGALSAAEVEYVAADPKEVSRRLREGGFTAVFASPATLAGMLDRFRRDELIIEHVDQGLAVLDLVGNVVWANPAFRGCACCDEDPLGKPLLDALGGARVASVERIGGKSPTDSRSPADPFAPARSGHPTSLRLHCPGSPNRPYLEADIRPVVGPDDVVSWLIAVVQNVTPEVVQQQRLDALHAAGRELAGLDPDQLSDMNIPSRVELLKLNLRKYVHDLLHYDTIEVRLLDRRTGELKPLLEDGMTAEAAGRVLFARDTGNGVTGYVASSGRSYLCRDTAADPLYIQGAEGARSSMTVPLKVHEEVIGTLNVESPRVNEFGADELQFTELFSKEVAAALHTLDLLSAQQECTASQSIEAVNKEIALPIDEVLASASLLIGKASVDPETKAHLRKILDNARLVKDSVSRVGRDMTPQPPPVDGPTDGLRLATTGSGIRPVVVLEPPSKPGTPSVVLAPGAPLTGRRVLVVDADERVRRQAHLLLTRLGATAETAETAAAGLAMAVDNSYDAIFLEVKPQDMSGFECYRRFRLIRPRSKLALTTGFGYDVAHSIVKARQEGLRYVLFKPFQEQQVVNAVLEPTPGSAGGIVGTA